MATIASTNSIIASRVLEQPPGPFANLHYLAYMLITTPPREIHRFMLRAAQYYRDIDDIDEMTPELCRIFNRFCTHLAVITKPYSEVKIPVKYFIEYHWLLVHFRKIFNQYRTMSAAKHPIYDHIDEHLIKDTKKLQLLSGYKSV
jgi:hypothetical protein